MQEAYAKVSDLMLGDMTLGRAVDPEKYLKEASEDIDISIGQVYVMPYNIETADAPRATVILLRRICSRLASGRLILAQAIGSEDKQLQAYGQHLIDEAESVIQAIKGGALEFVGPDRIEGADELTGPTVKNYDADSGVDAFYERFMTDRVPATLPSNPVWEPGG